MEIALGRNWKHHKLLSKQLVCFPSSFRVEYSELMGKSLKIKTHCSIIKGCSQGQSYLWVEWALTKLLQFSG